MTATRATAALAAASNGGHFKSPVRSISSPRERRSGCGSQSKGGQQNSQQFAQSLNAKELCKHGRRHSGNSSVTDTQHNAVPSERRVGMAAHPENVARQQSNKA